MRTLKKTLSLVLVVAMVLGLCVVGASATNKVDGYEDAGKIGAAYTEAVGVMTGLGIVDGVTDTELRPENTYQRDQAAKIIAYMLLGKDKAEKLSCTKAPFEDVPANHWAAGYIAFCKDVGIIDGVTETEFKPTAALTGFQWAKMLLSAVGFGVNGELEGDEWSIKTHVFGNAVNLFDGDIAAATHNALQRQQAMLLAFNVLTDVNVVVWSEALGDYIEGYYTFADRYTYQGTLGENVWKLTNATGVIVDNEGMGASVTYLDTTGKYSTADATTRVKIAADTGIDMMYHAARIWYVEGTKTNTGVYVKDLATVETTECPTAAAAATNKYVGDFANGVVYQRDVVDNGDYGKVTVDFYYDAGSRGPVSEADKSTVIDNHKFYNANIKTDISAVDYLDPVIYIWTTSKIETTDAKAYAVYVYTPTTTSGVVSKVATDGTVTLRDGTVIKESALSTLNLSSTDIGNNYTFLLDTHGHYYSFAENVVLVYFTGAVERISGSYIGEEVYNIQVVDVQTGAVSKVRVNGTWYAQNGGVVDTTNPRLAAGYYWLGEPSLNGVYAPTLWANYNYNTDAGFVHGTATQFRNTSGVKVINENSNNIDGVDYTNDSVTFVIASGTGSNLNVATYNGVSELLAAYNVSGATTGSVTLDDMAITTVVSGVGNVKATIVFAHAAAPVSRYVFVPYNITSSDFAQETVNGTVQWHFKGAYLNGTLIDLYQSDNDPIERGFYSISYDALGNATINPAAAEVEWFYETASIGEAGGIYYQDSGTLGRVHFTSDVGMYDFRQGVLDEKLDAVTAPALAQWFRENYDLTLAYTRNAAGDIDVCYVIEQNLGVVFDITVNNSAVTGDSTPTMYELVANSAKIWEDKITATLKIPTDVDVDDGTVVVVDFTLQYSTGDNKFATYDGTTTGVGVVDGDEIDVTFSIPSSVRGNYAYKIDVTGVTYPDFTVTNAATNFKLGISFESNDNIALTTPTTYVVKDLKLGDSFSIGLNRDNVANGTVATVDVTNYGKLSATFTSGQTWVSVTPTSAKNLTVASVTATYKYVLTGNTAVTAFSIATAAGAQDADQNEVTIVCEPGVGQDLYVKYSGNLRADCSTSNVSETNMASFKLTGFSL